MAKPRPKTNPPPSSRPLPAAGPAGLALSPALVCLLLALLTLAAYWPVLFCDFAGYDDTIYVTENWHVLQGLNWAGVDWAFSNLLAGFWHPLTWLSLMLDETMFGSHAGGFHLTNLLLHIGSTLVLFLTLRRATEGLWRAALVAALFALHPLHVEAVAWVGERKEVLGAFFGFVSLYFYVGYARAGTENRRSRITSYGWSLFFFICGLMSKPMVVTLPVVMLLLDYWPLDRISIPGLKVSSSPAARPGPQSFWQLILEKIPFFALALITGLLTIFAEKAIGAVSSTEQVPMVMRIPNALVSYVRYLEQTVWPVNLAIFYPYPHSYAPVLVTGSVLVLLAISAGALAWLRRRPSLAMGWLWFVITLLPVSGLIQVGEHSRADRYTYVPLVGLFILIVWGGGEAIRRWQGARMAAIFLAVLVLAACGLRSEDQLRYWRNSSVIFRHDLEVTQDNDLALNNVGFDLMNNEGRIDEAMDYFHRAVRLNPLAVEPLGNLGFALAAKGQYAGAISYYEQALRLNPRHYSTHNNLGNTLSSLGKLDEAIAEYRLSLKYQPDYSEAHNNLGIALAQKGELDEALYHFREAVRYKPNYAVARNSLGNVLTMRGQYAEALPEYEAALRADTNYAEAHNDWGYALAQLGRMDEAVPHYLAALRLNPGYLQAYYNVGCALMKLGRHDEAVAAFKQALRLKPDYQDVKQKLQELGVKSQ